MLMDFLRRDLVFALRSLRRGPGVAAVMVAIMAIGIGANTAIFSVVRAVILRPLPYPSPGRLVMLQARHRPNEMGAEVSVANYLDWRRESHSFSQLGAWAPASANVTGGDAPERLSAAQISPGGLAALGTPPRLGRLFLPDEERPDSRVAILSWGLWQSRFAGSRDVVGRQIRIGGVAFPIVGVMPREFRFPDPEVKLWIPLRLTESRMKNRQSRWLYAFGRLAPGATEATAQREMTRITDDLARRYPELNRDWGVRVVGMKEHLVGNVRPALLILLTAVLLVLAIACANIANLQLARAASRRSEMAIRSAMGASAGTILRQLLAEGFLLSAAAGSLGVLLARGALRFLVAWSPHSIPRLDEISIDGAVLVFALAISVATGIVFGLVPARSALRADVAADLGETGRGSSSSARQIRLRRLLTISEIATALVLLVGTGLLLTSLSRLLGVAPGFNPRGVITAELVLSPSRAADEPRRAAFFRELAAGARNLPGVRAAGGISTLPLTGSNATEGYAVEGLIGDPDQEAGFRGVTPGYFQTMEIRLLSGRDFSQADAANAPKVAIVNETLARRAWSDVRGSVGKRVLLGGRDGRTPYEVVGVIGDLRHTGLDVAAVPEIYVPYEQQSFDSMAVVIRSPLPEAETAAALRGLVRRIDPEQPVSRIRSFEAVLAESTSRPRFYTGLSSAFAGVALVLATVGLFSLISYSIAQRGRELAIRMALGARQADVLALVLKEGMTLAAFGIAAGLVLAWLSARGLSTMLFGVRPDDPAVFAATAGLLAAVSLAASLVPALRASRVDPVAVFRKG
ncbi:MAG: ABC transporter permease [Acidobacteriota bacterium]|nr:ABC transporter permease [Acidobacteriota bacterium]